MGHIPGGPTDGVTEFYHYMKQKYIMLRGGVLNGFYDIKPYMNWRALASATECVYHEGQQHIWFRDAVLHVS